MFAGFGSDTETRNAPSRLIGYPDLPLSGDTRLFPVLGDPVGQVQSPAALTRLLLARHYNAIVIPIQVAPTSVDAVIDALGQMQNVDGALVTVPHKAAAFPFCASVTERASFAGSVNVMRKAAGGWTGDNTDGAGYVDGLERQGFSVAGRSVLLVGCGGAGSAIAHEVLRRGAARLALHDVDRDRRDQLLARLAAAFPGRPGVGSDDPSGFDLIANATPMGMQPGDPLPVQVARLRREQFVACVVTRPAVPPLIEAARAIGCRTMTGADMFNAQAETLISFLLAGADSGQDLLSEQAIVTTTNQLKRED